MNALFIVYIAPIETITSPPGCKLFYCAEMPQFLAAVGSNCLPQHTQFPCAPTSFSRLGKHCSYVTCGTIHFIPNLPPVQNVVFDLRSRTSSLSIRVFAFTPMLSVPLGAGSGAYDLSGAPVASLVTPAVLRR